MKFIPSIVFFSIALCVMGSFASAQLAQSVSIIFDPASPEAGQTVNAQAVVPTIDPGTATFQWAVNGKSVVAGSGRGKNIFSFTLSAQSRTTVAVTVTLADGTELAATKALTPAQAIILWWADTEVPSWYEGKALAGPGSTVTIYALPGSGFGENPASLFYDWSVNVEPHPEVSGIGKNLFTLRVSLVQNIIQQIDVRITNKDQTIVQAATLLLPTQAPELLVYPLFAPGSVDSGNALSVFTGNTQQPYDFIAEPFFFQLNLAKNIVFSWRVNDKTLEGDFAKPNTLTLQPNTNGGPSQNTIQVDANTGGTNPESASAQFNANFQ